MKEDGQSPVISDKANKEVERVKGRVALIGLYNYKVLGVRYLASILEQQGVACDLICFKNFESGNMKKPTPREYELLEGLIRERQPRLIGVSVMSSLYLEAAVELTRRLRQAAGPEVPILWGGVYPTLFPEESLRHADLVVRGESDRFFAELVRLLLEGKREEALRLPNLAFRPADVDGGSGKRGDAAKAVRVSEGGADRGGANAGDVNAEGAGCRNVAAAGISAADSLSRPPGLGTLDELYKSDEPRGTDAPDKPDSGVILNPLADLVQDLDSIPFPCLGGENVFYIHRDRLHVGDPLVDSPTYETTCSRGCPFTCSYCSSLSLRKLYKGKGRFVRLRSVDNVLAELKWARERMKKMRMVIFWDEVFPDDPEWTREFAEKYRREIGLPFQIWGHPLRTRRENIDLLVKAGLVQAVVGIQSGSPRIRKKVFYRPESQEAIIEMSRILAEARVPEVIYDFILDHPFETEEDFRLTLELCEKLYPPFSLQLHGLSFLPGTAIVDLALEQGVVSREEMERLQNLPLEEQYRSFYWFYGGERVKYSRTRYWMNLIYFTQFPRLYRLIKFLAARTSWLERCPRLVDRLKQVCNYYAVGCRVMKKLGWFYAPGLRRV